MQPTFYFHSKTNCKKHRSFKCSDASARKRRQDFALTFCYGVTTAHLIILIGAMSGFFGSAIATPAVLSGLEVGIVAIPVWILRTLFINKKFNRSK